MLRADWLFNRSLFSSLDDSLKFKTSINSTSSLTLLLQNLRSASDPISPPKEQAHPSTHTQKPKENAAPQNHHLLRPIILPPLRRLQPANPRNLHALPLRIPNRPVPDDGSTLAQIIPCMDILFGLMVLWPRTRQAGAAMVTIIMVLGMYMRKLEGKDVLVDCVVTLGAFVGWMVLGS
jgi:hypothetical protein